MSHPIKPVLISFSLLTVMLSAPVPSFPQTNIPVKQETILTFAHDVLQIFYPELLDKDHRLTLCITAPGDDTRLEMTDVYFTVTPERVVPVEKLISSRPQTTDHVVLGGYFWLPLREYGRVQELRANSDAVQERELGDVHRLVASHPEWSETQIANTLKQAGARFGPDDKEAFFHSLPLNKAERFLGKLKITSVAFMYPKPQPNKRIPVPALIWTVEADAVLPDGTHPQYSFDFEPFGGKLIALTQSFDR